MKPDFVQLTLCIDQCLHQSPSLAMPGWKEAQQQKALFKQLQDFMVGHGAKLDPGGKGGAKAGKTGKKGGKKGGGVGAVAGAAVSKLSCTCCGKVGSHRTVDCHFIHEQCQHCQGYGHGKGPRCWHSPEALAAAASQAGGKAAGGKVGKAGKGPQGAASGRQQQEEQQQRRMQQR